MSEDGRTLDEVCEINVTPMIDVLLSLLIIFMVAAPPPPTHKQPIAMPKDAPVEQPDSPDATLLVTINADGSMLLGKNPLSSDPLKMVEALRNNQKAQADRRIAVMSDGKVPYGKVIAVMAAAREAGIDSVGIASERL